VRFIQCYAMPDGLRAAGTRDLARWCEAGRIRHPPTTVLPLVEAAKAHELVEAGAVIGKVLLRIS
jgi:NADPH2:quinone reductase